MYMHILCTHINIITNEAPPFSAKLGRRMSKLVLSGFAWVSCLWSLWPGKYRCTCLFMHAVSVCCVCQEYIFSLATAEPGDMELCQSHLSHCVRSGMLYFPQTVNDMLIWLIFYQHTLAPIAPERVWAIQQVSVGNGYTSSFSIPLSLLLERTTSFNVESLPFFLPNNIYMIMKFISSL